MRSPRECSNDSSTIFDEFETCKNDASDMIMSISSYANEIVHQMLMMKSNNILTDVVLEVDRELYHCHKVMLSAASPYFKAMFTGGLKECEMKRVKLQGVCPATMSRVILFIYSGQIRVTEVDVCQLLAAASMFQIVNIIEACCNFLERQLDSSNAIGIAEFAEQHGCELLKNKAYQYIERHFTKVCTEEEFLQLTDDKLTKLIRRDKLNVLGECDVYNAVTAWVRYDKKRRCCKFEKILSSVRCQYLAPHFIQKQMKTCEVLNGVPECREYLAKICQDLVLHRNPVVKERIPNTTRMIFIAGGYYRQSLSTVEAFDVDNKTWLTLPKLRVPRSGLGGAFLKGTFYAVGGRNNTPGSSYDSDWVDRYHPTREMWRPCAPMSVPRNRVGVAVMDERLYALGGSAASEFHDTVEYYDPDEDKWTIVKSMNCKRLSAGVAVVNRLLYAIGGFDGQTRLSSVEQYHPENNEWTMILSMNCARSGAGVASIGKYIYVVGGFDGWRQLSSVERFDTELNTWEIMAEITVARSALSLTALDGKLYAMGGYDGTNFLMIVEIYDPAENMWTVGVPLTSGRSGHAAAVIFQPSCTYDDTMSCGSEVDDIPHQETMESSTNTIERHGMLGGSGNEYNGLLNNYENDDSIQPS